MAEPDRHVSGRRARRSSGFRQAADLIDKPIRKASETRGFAVQRLLTHWDEIAGADVARIARPVKITYAAKGFGATLVLLTTGANAPALQMQLPRLTERINAAYGYAAITRIRITQTAGEVAPATAPQTKTVQPDPDALQRAADLSREIADPELREALSTIGAHIFARG